MKSNTPHTKRKKASKHTYQLIISELALILQKAWDWLKQALVGTGEFVWELVKSLLESLFEGFIKACFHAICDFIRRPSLGVQALNRQLTQYVTETAKNLTQPFNTPDWAVGTVALLWACVQSMFFWASGSLLPFTPAIT